MIQVDVTAVAKIIRDVSATEIMPRFKNLSAEDIREKKPGDFVTIADESAEKALSQSLRDFLPGSVVVGEEAVAKDEGVLTLLSGDKPVWVIDPIDGTYNFSHGRSKFGVMVALVAGGVTQYGWCYDAPGDRMAIAVKGRGATINGKTTHVRKPPADISEMSGMAGGAQAWHFDPVRKSVGEIVNVRSALHDFLTFASGEADFVLHVNKLTPWDHSASVLLAQEAGGYVALAGERVDFHPAMHRPAMLLATADKTVWDRLEPVFYPAVCRK